MISQKLQATLLSAQDDFSSNDLSNIQKKQYMPHEEEHIQVGQYLKSSVYGGLDSVVNTLTVILGGIASNSNPSVILAVGIAALFGDGLGMGLGDYLSAKSQKQFILKEQKRQLWQVKNKLADEKNQVIQVYEQKGYTAEQAHRLADLYSTNDQAFVDVMMLEELGLVVDDSNPLVGGFVTFCAFILFGFLPLIPYIIGAGIYHDEKDQYQLFVLIIGGVELFSLGFAKAALIGLNRLWSGIQTLLLGGVAVAVGYGIGFVFQNK